MGNRCASGDGGLNCFGVMCCHFVVHDCHCKSWVCVILYLAVLFEWRMEWPWCVIKHALCVYVWAA